MWPQAQHFRIRRTKYLRIGLKLKNNCCIVQSAKNKNNEGNVRVYIIIVNPVRSCKYFSQTVIYFNFKEMKEIQKIGHSLYKNKQNMVLLNAYCIILICKVLSVNSCAWAEYHTVGYKYYIKSTLLKDAFTQVSVWLFGRCFIISVSILTLNPNIYRGSALLTKILIWTNLYLHNLMMLPSKSQLFWQKCFLNCLKVSLYISFFQKKTKCPNFGSMIPLGILICANLN